MTKAPPALSESDRTLLRDAHETVLSPPSHSIGSLYKSALLVVVGITISLGAAYVREVLMRTDYVTRIELRSEMTNASPYVLEREMLREWRLRTDSRLTTIDAEIHRLQQLLVELQLLEATEHGEASHQKGQLRR